MLTTVQRLSVQVWMGKTLPAPLKPLLLDALSSCEVVCDALLGSAFRLSFDVDAARFSEYGPLVDSARDPFCRVAVSALLDLTRCPLIDGVVTEHRYLPSANGDRATVTLTGKDLSMLLDLEERQKSYENRTDSDIAEAVLNRYKQHKLQAKVTPTAYKPDSKWYVPQQQETDLALLQRLARRNGYIFSIESDSAGASMAYFGPLSADDEPPQKALSLGRGGQVRSLSIRHDALAPVEVSGATLDPKNGSLLLVSTPPEAAKLADEPTTARRKQWLGQLAHLPEGLAKVRVQAAQQMAEPSLHGEGELDTLAYGTVLRVRRRVEVQGLSAEHDGMYLVRSVTHLLAPGSYVQRFTLIREGTKKKPG